MIIVRIRGGLGNQIYQYVFASYLKKYTQEVYVDTSEFDIFKCHDGLEITDVFDISIPKAKYKDIIKLANYFPVPIKGKWGFILFVKMSQYEAKKMSRGKKATHILEAEFQDMSDDYVVDLLAKQSMYLDGYWNSNYYDLIPDFKLQFKKSYTDMYSEYTVGIDFKHSCSVHVRLGDYVGTEFDVCKADYYKRAIQRISEINNDVIFYVFSDDTSGAKRLLGENENLKYIDHSQINTAGLDMWLMSKFKYNIIPNSTYGYWAAKLNENIDKVVIMPEKFKDRAWNDVILL